jgi:hypothetical protein
VPTGQAPAKPFEKGNKLGRSRKGIPNLVTRETIIIGLSQLGEDDQGFDAMVGYVRSVGKDRRLGAGLLRAVMPVQIKHTTDPDKVYTTSEEIVIVCKERGVPLAMTNAFAYRLEHHTPDGKVLDLRLVICWTP